MRVRRALSLWLVVSSLAGFAVGCRGESEAAANLPVVPDFRLPTLTGSELGPSDYEGKVLLIDFWATWCTPCRAQEKILDRIYQDLRSEDLEFLGVSVGERPEVVERFLEKHPFSYPVVVDTHDQLSGELMVYVLPTVAVVDRQGRIVFFEMGISSEGTLRKVLDEALRSKAA